MDTPARCQTTEHWGSKLAGRVRQLLCLPLLILLVLPTAAQVVKNPRRIAEGPKGTVVVSDRTLGAVLGVDKESLQVKWSLLLPEDQSPFAVEVSRRLVLIGNTETGNVEVYRLMGGPPAVRGKSSTGPAWRWTFLFNLGRVPTQGPGYFQHPTDVVVDESAGQIFVLDSKAKKIFLFDKNGILLDMFSPKDSAGLLLSPVALGLDRARRELLVSDYGDPSGFFRTNRPARILIYSYNGDLLGQIDGNGGTHPSTKFLRPQGIAVGPMGRLFVPDSISSSILVIDRSTGATTLKILGTPGGNPGELRLPVDLVFDFRTGDLFVADALAARRIEVFRGVGRLP